MVKAKSCSTIADSSNCVGHLVSLHDSPTCACVQDSALTPSVEFCSTLTVLACTLIDTLFFSYLASSSLTTPPSPRSLLSLLTFTPYTFLLVNVYNSISLFYGSNTSHFYLTQALPFMTMTMLPFVLHGLWSLPRGSPARTARGVVAVTTAAYSLLAHKEFRFVHPLLPCVHVFAAYSLVSLGTRSQKPLSGLSARLGIRPSHIVFLSISLLPAIYLTAFHALGQNTVMDYLRSNPEVRSVGFLMPCHSTPWQSRLHRADLETTEGSGEGGRAWFLACEPPVL